MCVDADGEHGFVVVCAEQHGLTIAVQKCPRGFAFKYDPLGRCAAYDEVVLAEYGHDADAVCHALLQPVVRLAGHVVAPKRERGIGEIDGHGETSHMTQVWATHLW